MVPLALPLIIRLVHVGFVLGFATHLRYWRELYSSHGLVAISLRKKQASNWAGGLPYGLIRPSILWFYDSDAFILLVQVIGLLAAVLGVLSDTWALPMLIVATIIYSSFRHAVPEFFPVGGHMILSNVSNLVCLGWLLRLSPHLTIALLQVSYAAVMLASGLGKVLSDPGWRLLAHMDYHYWTQPLPTRLGYWLNNHMPRWFNALSTLATLVIELGCPLLVAWSSWARLVAFFACAALVVMINTTGNYGLFGFPLFVHSICFLDDRFFSMSPGPIYLHSDLHARLVLLAPLELAILAVFVILNLHGAWKLRPEFRKRLFASKALTDRLYAFLVAFDICTPVMYYWITPKRHQASVFAVRTTDRDEWHELALKHAIGPSDSLSPCFFGLWETPFAFLSYEAAKQSAWQDGTPDWVNALTKALLSGSRQFDRLFVMPPPPSVKEVRLRIYDYRFVGQDVHKLWRLFVTMGGKPPVKLPPQYLVGDKKDDLWKRELLLESSLDDKLE